MAPQGWYRYLPLLGRLFMPWLRKMICSATFSESFLPRGCTSHFESSITQRYVMAGVSKRRTFESGIAVDTIIKALDRFYLMGYSSYFRVTELQIGGKRKDQDHPGRIDYWLIKRPRSRRWIREDEVETIAIEIKVNRRDFLQELKNPQKTNWSLKYSNRFFFCAPEGLIKPSELPSHAGLLVPFQFSFLVLGVSGIAIA